MLKNSTINSQKFFHVKPRFGHESLRMNLDVATGVLRNFRKKMGQHILKCLNYSLFL